MRHDYGLPPDWGSMTDEEKSRWMTQERCRRQAVSQDTTSSKVITHERERLMIQLAEDGWVYTRFEK
jgi:phage pi2 protein 07